jgi:hypothetical protein
MIGLDGENLADLPECASTVRLCTSASLRDSRVVALDCEDDSTPVAVMVRTSSALIVLNRKPSPIRFESGTSTRTTSPIGSLLVNTVRGNRTLQRIGSVAVTVAD